MDKIFYTYVNEYDKKYKYYLIRCKFNIVFINMQGYSVASGKSTDNKKMASWKYFVEKVNSNFKYKGFDFSQKSQMNIIIVYNKMDMTYDFYMKHNMSAVEWKFNAMINKDKNLIYKFDRIWIQP